MAWPNFTEREQTHLLYVADGMSVEEAANEGHCSTRTVKEIRTNIRKKLGARTIANAVAIAYQKGLLKANRV